MDKISEQIKNLYKARFKKYGVGPKSLLWQRRGAAHQRFRQIWAEIDFNGKSVLDIGCGFGEMGKFLSKRYKGVNYTGIDIVPEFIEEAKRELPNLHFEVRDFFNDPIKEKFDVVIASGVLNSNVDKNMEYRKKAIRKIFESTKKVAAFNMLGAHPQPENNPKSNVWYADSMEILEYCLSLTRRVILRQNYHPRDFTIFMYRTIQKKDK